MAHPLEQRVDSIRRKAARMVRWIALCRVLAVVALVLVGVGLIDYLLRRPEPAVRWLLTAAVVGGAAAAAIRWGLPALRWRWSSVDMARRIERRFPSLGGRLSSSVAFSQQSSNDPTAGSLELRRAVIAETESAAAGLDFGEVLDRRPMRRATLGAFVTLGLLAAIGVIWPLSAGTAARRLLMPWQATHWPLRHSLEFVRAPQRLAAGDSFDAQVIDRNGRLPDRVTLQLRSEAGGRTQTRSVEMKPLDGRMVHRVDNVSQSFAYRAVGGDDWTMPWTEVEVIEPPRLVDMSLTVQPPSYTGLPAERLERVGRVLAGSAIALRGKLDKPAESVRLLADGKPVANLQAALDAEGRAFAIPAPGARWTAEKSHTYTLQFVDASGVTSGGETKLELSVVADAPPVVAWETPTDQTFATPRAVLPIAALVKDDLAVRSVVLRYLRPDATDADEASVVLFEVDAKQPRASKADGSKGVAGQSLTIDSSWDLAALGLQPGDVLAVRLEASDFRPQTATTTVRRLSIIDDAEFENRLLQRQTSVFTQLAEALRLEREALSQVGAILVRQEETGKLQAADVDQLQGAELMQRQVQRLLGDSSDGVVTQLNQLLDEFENNRVENEATVRRLSDLRERVATINRGWIPDIAQHLTGSLKTAREKLAEGGAIEDRGVLASVAQSLRAAEGRQQQVVAELEDLLGQLSEWDNFSRLAREIGQVREQQTKVHQETESLRWKIATAAGEQATPEQRASARQLAARQQELARRFDKLQLRMDELLARLGQSDPQSSRVLTEAASLSRRLAIGGQMRQAGRELADQRVGVAQQTQQKALASLAELLDALSSRRDRELLRTVESLRAAQSELDALRSQQQSLARMAEEAATSKDEAERRRQLLRLQREQQELAQKTDELRRKLERLQANRPAQSAGEGAKSMAGASEAAEAGDAALAEQQTKEASRLLDETRQQLQQEIEQAKADLVREQMARLEQSLTGLLARQKSVSVEIDRIDSLRTEDGSLPDAVRASLTRTSAEQQQLADETGELRTKLSGSAAIDLALEGVVRDMERTARLLAEERTDDAARQAATAATARLEQILAALREETNTPPSESQDGGEGGGGGQEEGEAMVQSIAELRLLAELQTAINERTAQLERRRQDAGRLTPEEQAELASLAAEQGRLAEIVDALAARAAKPGDEPPPLPTDDKPPVDGQNEDKPARGSSLDDELLRDLMGK